MANVVNETRQRGGVTLKTADFSFYFDCPIRMTPREFELVEKAIAIEMEHRRKSLIVPDLEQAAATTG